MWKVSPDRHWLRFSLERPCVMAQIALWIGAHDGVMTLMCLALLCLTLAWG